MLGAKRIYLPGSEEEAAYEARLRGAAANGGLVEPVSPIAELGSRVQGLGLVDVTRPSVPPSAPLFPHFSSSGSNRRSAAAPRSNRSNAALVPKQLAPSTSPPLPSSISTSNSAPRILSVSTAVELPPLVSTNGVNGVMDKGGEKENLNIVRGGKAVVRVKEGMLEAALGGMEMGVVGVGRGRGVA